MTITKHVVFVAKEGTVEELKCLLIDMVEPSRGEDGCLFYHINQIIDRPTTFLVLESWRDDDALEGHKNSEHYKYYKANFEQYTADKHSEELHPLV